METSITEDQIRSLAFELWEDAGSPDGRADEFWNLAQARLTSVPAADDEVANATEDSPADDK